MMQKKILRPERLRQVPAQFSWIDQRLVREDFLRLGEPSAWALYLVLVTVADAQGLSYYSEATLSRLLKLDLVQLAHHKPLYQVLALPSAPTTPVSQRSSQSLSAGDILRRALAGGAA